MANGPFEISARLRFVAKRLEIPIHECPARKVISLRRQDELNELLIDSDDHESRVVGVVSRKMAPKGLDPIFSDS